MSILEFPLEFASSWFEAQTPDLCWGRCWDTSGGFRESQIGSTKMSPWTKIQKETWKTSQIHQSHVIEVMDLGSTAPAGVTSITPWACASPPSAAKFLQSCTIKIKKCKQSFKHGQRFLKAFRIFSLFLEFLGSHSLRKVKTSLQGVVLNVIPGIGGREEKKDTKGKYFFYLKKATYKEIQGN